MRIAILFGSKDCDSCQTAWQVIESYGISEDFLSIYVDALADETQNLCDFYDVDELPHIVYMGKTTDSSFIATGIESLPDVVRNIDSDAK